MISSGDEDYGGGGGGEVDSDGSEGQMEILELEMRARAIKAMLKAQEELDKAEKLRAQINTSSAGRQARHARATDGTVYSLHCNCLHVLARNKRMDYVIQDIVVHVTNDINPRNIYC